LSVDTRAAAALAIADVFSGQSLDRALARQENRVKTRDLGLLRELCYGTLRHEPRLTAILAQLLDKPLKDKDRDIQALLLCGLYQLDFTRVPDHAAVAATVEATRALKKHWAKNLSNALLRRFLREREPLLQALDDAASSCHPRWLYDKIKAQWPAAAGDILLANNEHPPMTLRVNTARVSREQYLKTLAKQGIGSSEGLLSPHAIYLSQAMDVSQLPGFQDGMVSVQDEAAQLAAILLSPGPGERVLDVCAAPGGKTCHILELQEGLEELVAMDVERKRLDKVSENLARLGLVASLVCADGTAPPEQLSAASFDRILVDAPCSASGVIRRHPDVKQLRKTTDIATFSKLQTRLLLGVWPLLKPHGTLLYATCSLFREENGNVVSRFLEQQSDAVHQALDTPWGEASSYGKQLLPSSGGSDGLFYALLQKTAS